MRVTPGVRLGPYEVLAPIGAGGMGEVWRGRDARIGRDVAIKFLPSAFLSNADRLHRFEQEARAAGSLNHPNLVTVYDVGVEDGARFVVMELLDGETLREKLGDGDGAARLPPRKALDYGVQIAHGLAAAHEQGVVHRDLKPENIVVTRDGRVKILDFGLAKLSGSRGDDATDAQTQQRDTAPGTVLGTAGYMSPEQVRGQPVDYRTDIFSFGAILYEMLTGRRAFKGESSVETMNAVLKEDPPDMAAVQPGVGPAVDMVVRHCLEKNPEERFQSARDLAFDLQRISSASGPSPAIAAPRRTVTRWIAPLMAAAVLVAATVIAWRAGYRSAASAKATPSTHSFKLLTNQPGVEEFPSLAPDGKTFVFVSSAAGNPDIYLQRVDGRNAINLTKDSLVADTQPSFSPDGSQIAFRSERVVGGIFIMGATGESVRRLTDFGFNPTWSPDGSEIAVATEGVELQPHARPGKATLFAVDVRSGAKRDLNIGDGVQPNWSPHGDRIAYWSVAGEGGQRDIYTVDPHAAHPEQTITRLTNDPPLDWNPVWSPDGKYLYFGSDRDGTLNLWRMPMDEHSGKALGPPEPVSLPTRFAAHFSFARNTGALVYAGVDLSDTVSRVAFDPLSLRVNGTPSPIFGGAMLFLQSVDVSPDGKWIAFSNIGTQEDLFVARTDGSEMRQLTNDPEKDRGPSWSPDGRRLYFYSQRGPRYETWSIGLDGSGLRQVSHTQGPSVWWPRLMPDGRAFYAFNGGGTYLLTLNADGTATRIEPLPRMPDPQMHFYWPRLSPDGTRFVGSSLSRAVSGPLITSGLGGGVWLYSIASKTYQQIANHGGVPRWLPDGKHVLFLSGSQLEAVDVDSKQVRSITLPRPIVAFSVSPDGRTLYVNDRSAEADIWLMSSR
jgi:serine/threonine protein kinase